LVYVDFIPVINSSAHEGVKTFILSKSRIISSLSFIPLPYPPVHPRWFLRAAQTPAISAAALFAGRPQFPGAVCFPWGYYSGKKRVRQTKKPDKKKKNPLTKP
jgi:hypothetical protein